MTKTDTVKDLKLKIYNLPPNPSPIYQRLWFGELELTNEMTVQELGLGEGSAIDLLIFDEDSGKADWGDVEKKEAKEGRRKREEGFGGTGLLGGWGEMEDKVGLRLGDDGEVEVVPVVERGADEAAGDEMEVEPPAAKTRVVVPRDDDDLLSPPPSPKKPKVNTVAPGNPRKGKPSSNSSLFGLDKLTSLAPGSKRAAREAASRSPDRLRVKGEAQEASVEPRARFEQASRTSDYSQMELDGDDDAAIAAALAASVAEGELERESGSGGGGGACSKCTFVNEEGVGRCAMCEAWL